MSMENTKLLVKEKISVKLSPEERVFLTHIMKELHENKISRVVRWAIRVLYDYMIYFKTHNLDDEFRKRYHEEMYSKRKVK